MLASFKDIHREYTLVEEKYIEEVKSQAALLRHNKTGAMVAVLSNDDKNKVFSVAFRTPPKDSTGVAHILEHSVLCGSKNFPVKDPFVELVKGSLNTFLNAMTFPDKTMYPVASCNDKDFQNLMHVYLDSVFYPNIYEHEEIFLQEGWHYELNSPEDKLTYNGVVYNEMKGAFSSPDQLLSRKICEALYPDITYGQESGGDPDHIPELSYEEFLDFHRKYYHPSNSYIYLYGDFDPREKLDFIHEAYLKDFDALDVASQIGVQPPFGKLKEVEAEYSIGSGEALEDNTYLTYSVVLPKDLSPDMYIAFQVLDYALMSCPGAPLKKALIDSGIARDVYCEYEKSLRQPFFSVVAKSSNPECKDTFMQIIRDTLSQVVREGVLQDSIRAALNTLEFKFREADFGWVPEGLMYGIQMLDGWLYDASKPFVYVECFKTFEFLKAQIGTDYYESLIKTWLLNNAHSVLLVFKPCQGLGAKKEQELADRLAEKKAAMDEKTLQTLVEKTKALKKYQETPSTQEELATVPMLKLSDIDKKSAPIHNKVMDFSGISGLLHDYDTHGIAYVKLMFPMTVLDEALIPYAGLLGSILGNVDTNEHSYLELNNEIYMSTGGIYTNTCVYGGPLTDAGAAYKPYFEVSGKALYDQLPVMFKLMKELMFGSDLKSCKRIREIIHETASRMEMAMISNGHTVAVNRATSYFSESGYYGELLSGLEFYRFIKDLAQNFDDRAQELTHNLAKTAQLLFTAKDMLVDYTSPEDKVSALLKAMEPMQEALVASGAKAAVTACSERPLQDYVPQNKREGLVTAGTVQYNAVAGNFRQAGYKFHGGLNVLKVIMSYEYLWTNIRVKGGAYGCMCGFSRNGNAYFVSYRDPKLVQTFDIYKNCADYLRSFDVSDRDMLKYIIGAISAADSPLKPKAAGARSLSAYMSGLTMEDIQRTRDEILSTSVDTIRGFGDLVEAFVSQDNLCVVGSETELETHRELFGSISTL